MGKYLAALGIFTVSLLFSLVCNYLVLNNLASTGSVLDLSPRLDLGLFLGTYAGYWLVGLAMLGIGLVASFLTGNVTIGFVLGVVFNLPLVFLLRADASFGAFSRESVQAVTRWSIGQQMHDFSRGMLSLAGVVYFFVILAVMLYASMALIGRRHWFSGPWRWLQVGHFLVRGLALVVIAVCAVVVLRAPRPALRRDQRKTQFALARNAQADRRSEDRAARADRGLHQPQRARGIRANPAEPAGDARGVAGDRRQQADGEDSRHRSLQRRGRLGRKTLRHPAAPGHVDQPRRLSRSIRYSSTWRSAAAVRGRSRRRSSTATRPIEYELVRSICTVTEQKRKKVGVLNTDAQLYGSFNFQTMSPSPNWPIIDELEKQYEVVRVDPSKPITEKYDVLLAVQPSTLGPEEMNNFIAAVAAGQPTAIFEDPAPLLSDVPATSLPRQPPGGMNPMMRMQAPPKATSTGSGTCWASISPTRKSSGRTSTPTRRSPTSPKNKEFVFADVGSGAKQPFNPNDPISSGLQQVLFPFPGFIDKQPTSELKFTPLVETGEKTGTVRYADLMQMSPFGPRGVNPDRPHDSDGQHVLLGRAHPGQGEAAPVDRRAVQERRQRRRAKRSPSKARSMSW